MSVMKGCVGGGGGGTVVCSGYLKKLKTYRRKFFVLRAESPECSARLEYYDSDKKFNSGQPPKRSIPLKNCFNINRRSDTKYKHVIALYTKDDVFCMCLDNEEQLDTWLRHFLRLQHGEEDLDGETPRPTFEHVWKVEVLNRGLGDVAVTGRYNLCLTDKVLTFFKLPDDRNKDEKKVPEDKENESQEEQLPNVEPIELSLNNIRSCGSLRDFFFLEIGRSSGFGAGELWMQTADTYIADNMHAVLFHQMTSGDGSKDHRGRNRSSSATESSKPTGIARRIQGSLPKCHILTQGLSGGRERCDSMPSRARTASEGTHLMWNQVGGRPHVNPYRPASLYGRDISHSPPAGSPVSPPSVSTDSAGSSYSLADENDVCTELEPTLGRYGHSLTPDEAIAEEDCPDSPLYSQNYVSMGTHGSDDGYVDMSPRGQHHNNSPTTSMCSVTSGTPSTDMRFAEYPLEKVASYLSSEVDDARPARAYSVGSKPEGYKNMGGQTSENLRVRALSVGSKAKKVPGRVLPPHGYHAHNNQGTKSSSAPLLSNSRGQGSHNSIGPMDDLMEMDFSRSGSINNSGYMDMRPGPKVNHHGYVEMKPGRHPDTSPYVDMSQGSSPARPSYMNNHDPEHSDYMEMDPRKLNNNNNSDYLTMSFNKKPTPTTNYQLSPAKSSFLDVQFGSPKTEPVTPDGYVEMSLGRGHQRQSSLDSAQIVNEDYTNMSMGKKRDRNARKKEKTRSQPIAIQNSTNQKVSASSSSPRYSLLGRKFSTGTPPMHLPLTETTPYSSLPRQRRRESKDSSSSSVTTPSSSSTIFPFSLNSPCSPVKPDKTPPQKTETNENDYIPMDFENQSDYVNYNPQTPVNEDYAIMTPGVGVRVTTPSMQMAMMQLSDSASFRPINETRDEETRAYEVLRNRPASVADSLRSSLSRPSSTSSEVCSSGSNTIVGGSRPESVNSDRVRPASVSSADTLHYASLDLEDGNRSPRTVKSGSGEAPSGAEMTLTYAAIDFVKSEGLKHNLGAPNAKIKH